ncbi:MAG: hypothetical protein ACT4P1_03975 [Sporichthyaceae bacterium]
MGNRAKPTPRPEGVGGRLSSIGALLRSLGTTAELRVAALTAALTIAIAPYVGMVWQAVAPTPTYVNIAGDVFLDNQDTSEFIAADGWFLILGLLVGAISGGLGYWRWRGDLGAILGTTFAALLAAYLAREVGQAFGPPPISATAFGLAEGETVNGALELRADAVLLAWPVGVLVSYLSLIGGLERTPAEAEATGDAPEPAAHHGVPGAVSLAKPRSVEAAGVAGEVGAG